jgi:hypothetical protein
MFFEPAHSIAAEGTWPSAVLADGGVLKRLTSRLRSRDPLALQVESSRLYIGTFSLEATVLGSWNISRSCVAIFRRMQNPQRRTGIKRVSSSDRGGNVDAGMASGAQGG